MCSAMYLHGAVLRQGAGEGGGRGYSGAGAVRQSAVQSVMLSRRVVPSRGEWPKLCPSIES